MATDGEEADRLDGQRHAAGRALRPAAVALQLLQAAVRPGHQPAAGRDSRRDHHLDDHHDRLRRQPARRDARAVPAAAARAADPHQRRAGADQGSSTRPGCAAARSRRCFRAAKGPTGMRRRMDELRARSLAGDRRGRHDPDPLRSRRERRAWCRFRRCWPPAACIITWCAKERRTRCGLVVETGEAREVHHFALLTGYGAGAVNPYLAFATLRADAGRGLSSRRRTRYEKLEKNYIKAVGKGVLKVMSKMGISTQQSYRGAQIFEAIGLNTRVRRRVLHLDRQPHRGRGPRSDRRRIAPPPRARLSARRKCRRRSISTSAASINGVARARPTSSAPTWSPSCSTPRGSTAARSSSKFCQLIDDQQRQLLTLRGLLEFKPADSPMPLDEVEPATEIVKRFATGRHVVRLDLARKRTRRWPSP